MTYWKYAKAVKGREAALLCRERLEVDMSLERHGGCGQITCGDGDCMPVQYALPRLQDALSFFLGKHISLQDR